MKKNIAFLFCILWGILNAVARQEETAFRHDVLVPLAPENVELQDFFWCDAVKKANDIDSLTPISEIRLRASASEKARLLKEWTERLSNLTLAGGVGPMWPVNASHTLSAIETAEASHQLALWTGQTRYVDVMERALYNGVLAGLSETLPIDVRTRAARLVRAISGYVYAVHDRDVYVNLFVRSLAQIKTAHLDVQILQITSAPWDNSVSLVFRVAKPESAMRVWLRLPEWLRDESLSGYEVLGRPSSYQVRINGEVQTFPVQDGYLVIDRKWRNDDELRLEVRLPAKRVHPLHKAELGLQRGPLVYGIMGPLPSQYVLEVNAPLRIDFSQEYQAQLIRGQLINNNRETRPFYALPYAYGAIRLLDISLWVPTPQQPDSSPQS